MRGSNFIQRQKSRLANTALAAFFESRKKSADEQDPDMEYVVPNHDDRRRMARRERGGNGYTQRKFGLTPYAHKTGRTGTPKHVAQWHHEAQVRRMLSAIPTTDLVIRLELDGPMAKSVASIATLCPTVWDLTQEKRKNLLALPGVGPKTLASLKQKLAMVNVTTRWQVQEPKKVSSGN